MATTTMRRLTGLAAGSALAFGLTAGLSTPAEAATDVWDKVAACESSGNWAINTGNGYYGGLQFSPRTWKGFGGKAYGSQAHRATKAEQIAIARKVLAVQGPGAWPTCGKRAGLTRTNGQAASTPAPTQPTASSPTPAPVVKKAKKVTVRAGDTLARIAHRHHVAGGWKGLWKLNRKTVHNPNQLKIGWLLIVKKY